MNETHLTCLSTSSFKSRMEKSFFSELLFLKENERNSLVGATSRMERERGKKKSSLSSVREMFPRVLDKLGTNTPGLSDSVRVLDSVAGWGRRSVGI